MQVRDKFKKYLISSGKQEPTSVKYARYIDAISDHCGTNIFGIEKVGELQPLADRYSNGGSDYEFGNLQNGGPRAAIRQYLAFLQGGPPAPDDRDDSMDDNFNENLLSMTASTKSLPPLNQILYGPPGTGKTHNTIEEALAILDPAFLQEHRAERTKLRARFSELEASKHIRFVTFHQSFSYEDFVEGLCAVPDEVTKQLRFAPVSGVFKQICDDASVKVVVDEVLAGVIGADTTIWKMSLGNRSDENHIYEECIREKLILLGWGSGHNYSGATGKADIIAKLGGYDSAGKAPGGVTAVNYFVLQMKVGDLVIVADGNSKFRAIGQVTGDYAYLPREQEGDEFSQSRSVRWLKVFDPSMDCSALMPHDFTQGAIYKLSAGVIDRVKLGKLLSADASGAIMQGGPSARVLIIDEINRGNISRIFGELITLLEPSKRAGNSEALSVTLPYSKKTFSIPNNLYVIGTMNSSDRSLTGLDIALRRRFVFKEMPPRPELLAGVDVDGVAIDKLLKIMNQRIEALLDREHCLGHAYFLPLRDDSSIECLANIFEQQVLPLLKEYFFEDWDRIRWVLNDHRKLPVNCFVLPSENNAAALFGDDFQGKVQEQTWTINEDAFDRYEAYLGIIDSTPVVTSKPIVANAATEGGVEYGGYRLERWADTTVKVYEKGVEQPAMPILKKLATELGVSHFNKSGGIHNTRQLGAHVIAAVRQAAS